MGDWVDAAQVASGFAALAAVWLAVVTARSARRVPLTDAYMGAWQSILDVLSIATEGRDDPPPEEEADRLLRRYVAADHQLSVIEATLRVRVYGREIRGDGKNLLIDTLYDNPEIRGVEGRQLTLADYPREDWADCTDDQWVRVVNSVPFTAMLASEVWDAPGRPTEFDLMRWYFPAVLQGLDSRDSVTRPGAAPQRQLAFMLGGYVDAFLLPWIRDASREALMGRIGARPRLALLLRDARSLRRTGRTKQPANPGLLLFETTRRDR